MLGEEASLRDRGLVMLQVKFFVLLFGVLTGDGVLALLVGTRASPDELSPDLFRLRKMFRIPNELERARPPSSTSILVLVVVELLVKSGSSKGIANELRS